MNIRYQLENPNNYENLRFLWENKSVKNISDFLEDHQNRKEVFVSNPGHSSIVEKLFNKRMSMFKQVNSINLTDFYSFTKFSLYFGPSIFILWKYVLLNKRIMFYALPPINDLCARVLCSSLMLSTSFNFSAGKQMLKPYFYVSVNDINQLQQEPFYLACNLIFIKKTFIFC